MKICCPFWYRSLSIRLRLKCQEDEAVMAASALKVRVERVLRSIWIVVDTSVREYRK